MGRIFLAGSQLALGGSAAKTLFRAPLYNTASYAGCDNLTKFM